MKTDRRREMKTKMTHSEFRLLIIRAVLSRNRSFSPEGIDRRIAEIIRNDNDRIGEGVKSVYENAEGITSLIPKRHKLHRLILKYRLARRTERDDFLHRLDALVSSN